MAQHYAVRRDGLYYIDVYGAFYSPTWVSRKDAGRFSSKADAQRVARAVKGAVVLWHRSFPDVVLFDYSLPPL